MKRINMTGKAKVCDSCLKQAAVIKIVIDDYEEEENQIVRFELCGACKLKLSHLLTPA